MRGSCRFQAGKSLSYVRLSLGYHHISKIPDLGGHLPLVGMQNRQGRSHRRKLWQNRFERTRFEVLRDLEQRSQDNALPLQCPISQNIAVVGIDYALVAMWWKRDYYQKMIARPASMMIAASGLYWAVERTF